MFDPKAEPCNYCGREADECICALAPDFPDDYIEELDGDYLDWGFYEESNNETDEAKDSGSSEQDIDND